MIFVDSIIDTGRILNTLYLYIFNSGLKKKQTHRVITKLNCPSNAHYYSFVALFNENFFSKMFKHFMRNNYKRFDISRKWTCYANYSLFLNLKYEDVLSKTAIDLLRVGFIKYFP